MWHPSRTHRLDTAAVLIYLASQNGHFQVKRSLEIDATVESVFAAVLDLNPGHIGVPG